MKWRLEIALLQDMEVGEIAFGRAALGLAGIVRVCSGMRRKYFFIQQTDSSLIEHDMQSMNTFMVIDMMYML